MALNYRDGERMSRQLLGVKRTRHFGGSAAVIDPKRTWGNRGYASAK